MQCTALHWAQQLLICTLGITNDTERQRRVHNCDLAAQLMCTCLGFPGSAPQHTTHMHMSIPNPKHVPFTSNQACTLFSAPLRPKKPAATYDVCMCARCIYTHEHVHMCVCAYAHNMHIRTHHTNIFTPLALSLLRMHCNERV